jgi:hypothetical protein
LREESGFQDSSVCKDIIDPLEREDCEFEQFDLVFPNAYIGSLEEGRAMKRLERA